MTRHACNLWKTWTRTVCLVKQKRSQIQLNIVWKRRQLCHRRRLRRQPSENLCAQNLLEGRKEEEGRSEESWTDGKQANCVMFWSRYRMAKANVKMGWYIDSREIFKEDQHGQIPFGQEFVLSFAASCVCVISWTGFTILLRIPEIYVGQAGSRSQFAAPLKALERRKSRQFNSAFLKRRARAWKYVWFVTTH